jgi:hypothetical protein
MARPIPLRATGHDRCSSVQSHGYSFPMAIRVDPDWKPQTLTFRLVHACGPPARRFSRAASAKRRDIDVDDEQGQSLLPVIFQPRTSLISSRMAGSSIVAGILSSASPSAIFCMVARRILPDRVLGKRGDRDRNLEGRHRTDLVADELDQLRLLDVFLGSRPFARC